jgi:phage terminase small subunit
VLREIAAIAMVDIGRFLIWGREEVEDENGNPVRLPDGEPLLRPFCRPIPSHQMTKHERRAIKSMRMSRNGTFKIKVHDKLKALELLGRHLGFFEKNAGQKGSGSANTMAQLIADCQGAPLMPRARSYDA